MTTHSATKTTPTKQRLIVIGNGMVGHRLLEDLVNQGGRECYDITVLCEESRPAYDRVQLSAFFSGKTADDLSLVNGEFFADHAIDLKLNVGASTIDTGKQTVTTTAGQTLAYDKLVLATGSFPFVPPIPGKELPGCLVYRTIDDLEAITAAGKQSKIGTVVGGGLLGLEAAKALKDMGLETHVVEFAPRLMAVQVDDQGGALLRRKIEDLGVIVHTEKNTQNIVAGDDTALRMEFADGETLDTDIILFSAGIRPRDELARDSGLTMGERGGIVIDNHCQTSDDNVYAIGECAQWSGQVFGLVAPGYDMARVVAQQLTAQSAAVSDSEPAQFQGADMSTKLKLMGVDVASIGDCHARTEGAQSYQFIDSVNGVYKKLVVSADRKQMLGAVLVGDADDYGNLLQLALNNIELPEQPEALILPTVEGGAATGLGVDALPATAQICSCNNVDKGAICSAVEGGAATMGAIKDCTKAATSCGGCTALVKQVMDKELERAGVAVNNDLCEHFAHTRQELHHIVRVEKIKTFEALVEKHGKGKGCDVCKPTVGSILASVWNEHVLKPMHAQLQDTNDHFLANMQKDGTYSVVPRVPGGEITPDKLIVLGAVAKKYDLYTKVTGGQRIDLFGAQLHQLPLIWEELIEAGFESGHAYGKSMRTVKSCVGSTWCRYGVQDSVGMAIFIEERYRGVRAPHKFKLAVSGCTRECAEAQSKDVGVIATENGWNLYVCGNGGMKPRHADLLASDLDDETLVKYIDRFLMFYIRTADRLQRTASWMDNLEGGLDYLKQVVCDDKLNIAAELEAEMAHLVDTYECEWKKAVETPDIRKRFRHFVNSPDADSNVVFVRERNQIRPANSDERDALEEKVA